MSEWATVSFQELAAAEKSAFSKPYGSAITKEDYLPDGVPMVRGVNLSRGIFLDDDFVFISDEKADRMPGANLAAGDLVITHRGTIGQVSMIPRSPRYNRYVLSTSQVKARLDPKLAHAEFYYYWLISSTGQHELLGNTSTVGVPGIAQPVATIKSLRVPHPPLSAQKAIAELLGALDEKIAVNDRIATKAFGLAEAHYIQLITQSAKHATVGELLELKYGKALPASSRTMGTIPVYGSGGISGSHNQSLVTGPGVIVGRKGTVGAVYWAEKDFYPIDTTFYVGLSNSELSMEFAFFMLRSLGLTGMNSDSAVPGLNRSNALALSTQVPEAQELKIFREQVRPVFELRQKMSEESATLAELRDTLLQKLMSGEIRVRDAEKVVEEVV